MRRPQSPPVVPEVSAAAHYAHDLRNLLATVLGHAELQLDQLDPGDRAAGEAEGSSLARSLQAIHLTAGKAAAICEEMVLELRRGAAPARPPERFALAEVARAAAEVVRARSGSPLRLDLDGCEEVEVLASRPCVERAVLNLLWNAQEASQSVSADRARVRTRGGQAAAGPGGEVAAPGPGRPEGRLGDLTQPFRSVQRPASGAGAGGGGGGEPGRPRGLGLTTVQETMRRCGGQLRGRNAPGGGAVIRLEFPNPASGELSGFPG